MANDIRPFEGPDGTRWGVEVKVPGASNAMVVFHHPGGKTGGNDRYAWYNWHGPESRSVTSRITQESVMKKLSDDDLTLLLRRSFKVAGGHPVIRRN